MPICPRCERNVSYQELDVHERFCEGSPRGEPGATASREQLEAKITYVESQVEDRIDELEKELQRLTLVGEYAEQSMRMSPRK